MQQSRAESEINPVSHRQYRFAGFLLDESRGALLRDGVEIPLRRQTYDMLVLLVEHQGELLSKDFLMDAIWSDAVVTENSLTQCLKEIRRAIGDHDRSMIRTLPRRGYILDIPVERLDTGAGSVAGAGAPNHRWLVGAVAILAVVAAAWWALQSSPPTQTTPVVEARPPPAKSVAVLPFINMSPDLDVSYLADGVSEEILNQLAQIPDLLVIARTSSFTFRGRDVDIATIGRQLNVAHVLEGSVRVEGDTARVTAQLVSTDNQAHLWSRSYDRALDNIFDLQRGIARDVAEQLHVALADAGEGKSQRDHKPHPEAHAAMAWVLDNKETKEQALFHFRRAVELRPNYADGAMWLSDFLISKGQYEESFELLERAVRSDPLSVVAMWNYSVALMRRGRLEEAGTVLEKLASLAPSFHRDLSVVFRGRNGQWAEAALTSLEARLEESESPWLDSQFAIYLASMGMDENALALTHVEEALLFEVLGRPQDIVKTYEQVQTDRGLRDTQKYILGEALAATGDFERALPYLEENWLYMDRVVAPPWFDAKAALALIAARRASGEDPGTEALAAALQENARRYRDAGIVECLLVSVCIDFEIAIADYLSGDLQSAVRLLTKAVSRGYLIPPNSAYLQFLYDDPHLAPVFDRQRAHQRAQRQTFLQAICPENPYAEVWEPVEGTCETDLEDSAVAVREPERGR